MTEHRIRLRGGWECQPVDALPGEATRLALPIRWDPDRPRCLRLTRRFHRPPLDAQSHLVLLLEHVPGLRSLQLNGQSPVPISPERSRYEIPLAGLPERNLLVLEVETPRATDPAGGDAPGWGCIALVIRAAGPAAAP